MSSADLPAMEPPSGVQPNFDNPPTTATCLMAVNWVFTPIAITMGFIRIFTRATLKQQQGLGWDDVLIVIALVARAIAHAVLVTIATRIGYGRHLWDMPAFSLTESRMHIFTSFEQTYFVTLFFIKMSILILYKRLFGIYETSRRLIHAGFVIVTLVTIPAFAIALARSVQCDGYQALSIALCHTQNVRIAVTVFSVCNTVTDFYALVIPINRIVKLHVDLKKKLGLLAIFLGGLVACSMSVIRLAMINIHSDSRGLFWNGSKVTPFTIVEMNLGIVCSCMMFLPAFCKKVQETVYLFHGLQSGSSRRLLVQDQSSSNLVQSESDSNRDFHWLR